MKYRFYFFPYRFYLFRYRNYSNLKNTKIKDFEIIKTFFVKVISKKLKRCFIDNFLNYIAHTFGVLTITTAAEWLYLVQNSFCHVVHL